MKALLPQPLISMVLVLIWLALAGSITPGQLLLATVLGVLIPLLCRRFLPEPLRILRVGPGLRFLGMLLWDILIANLAVARLILRPRLRLRPQLVRVPIELRSEPAIAALLGAISLTPGTLAVELGEKRDELLVHVLDTEDAQQVARTIKSRYERPLMEIFEC